jgi:hypothetical protein
VAPRYITKVTDYDGRILEEDYSDIKDVSKFADRAHYDIDAARGSAPRNRRRRR